MNVPESARLASRLSRAADLAFGLVAALGAVTLWGWSLNFARLRDFGAGRDRLAGGGLRARGRAPERVAARHALEPAHRRGGDALAPAGGFRRAARGGLAAHPGRAPGPVQRGVRPGCVHAAHDRLL